MNKLHIAGAVALGILGLTAAMPASAGTGCNGVINPFVWGCAPWDNNNGPQFPYYKKTRITIPKEGTQIVNKNGTQMALRNGTYYPLVTNGGGTLVTNGGSTLTVLAP